MLDAELENFPGILSHNDYPGSVKQYNIRNRSVHAQMVQMQKQIDLLPVFHEEMLRMRE